MRALLNLSVISLGLLTVSVFGKSINPDKSTRTHPDAGLTVVCIIFKFPAKKYFNLTHLYID